MWSHGSVRLEGLVNEIRQYWTPFCHSLGGPGSEKAAPSRTRSLMCGSGCFHIHQLVRCSQLTVWQAGKCHQVTPFCKKERKPWRGVMPWPSLPTGQGCKQGLGPGSHDQPQLNVGTNKGEEARKVTSVDRTLG